MYKTFKEHLTESKKQYDFRIKIAGDFTAEQENTMKNFANSTIDTPQR